VVTAKMNEKLLGEGFEVIGFYHQTRVQSFWLARNVTASFLVVALTSCFLHCRLAKNKKPEFLSFRPPRKFLINAQSALKT
jgi:hypothetical protein